MDNVRRRRRRRKMLTTIEKELFQIMQKTSDVIDYQIDIHAIKQFFERHISSPSFNINCSNEGGLTLLMNMSSISVEGESVYECDVMEVIMILLEKGADINVKDCFGWTALEIACRKSSYNVVKLLLVHGAYSHIRDSCGNTPLWITAHTEKYDIMEALIKYGVGDVVNIKNNFDDAPTHVLLRKLNKLDSVPYCFKLLVKYSADINVQIEMGMTPLFLILITRKENDVSLSVIRLLLDANADLNMQFKSNMFPIFWHGTICLVIHRCILVCGLGRSN